jgi:hypothetical protein
MLLLPLFATACATAAARLPLTDVPPGTYVMVEPASETYNAVTIGANSFSYRNGDETGTGQHWLDSDGRVHIVDDSGECAGQESIWTYQYTGNRISMTKVSDACAGREMPATMVYERR